MTVTLDFAPLSRRSAGRYTATLDDRRYLIEYRRPLGSWTVIVNDARGSHELCRVSTITEAQNFAQRHAGGQE